MLNPFPIYGGIVYSYHGTSPNIAIKIKNSGISVSYGGGELGQGFYTGEYMHEAKAWSYHTTRSLKNNVVIFEQTAIDISILTIKKLNIKQATLTRTNIRQSKNTRLYLFNVDMVISKIVGSTKVTGSQLKWESVKSEIYLNSSRTISLHTSFY